VKKLIRQNDTPSTTGGLFMPERDQEFRNYTLGSQSEAIRLFRMAVSQKQIGDRFPDKCWKAIAASTIQIHMHHLLDRARPFFCAVYLIGFPSSCFLPSHRPPEQSSDRNNQHRQNQRNHDVQSVQSFRKKSLDKRIVHDQLAGRIAEDGRAQID
jgi:hypothetical protein